VRARRGSHRLYFGIDSRLLVQEAFTGGDGIITRVRGCLAENSLLRIAHKVTRLESYNPCVRRHLQNSAAKN